MACMSHDCLECGHIWFDNDQHPLCPNCGASGCTNLYDEEGCED